MNRMKIILFIQILILCLFPTHILSQERDSYQSKYDAIINARWNVTNSLKNIEMKAKSGNTANFILIGYFINANNIMYEKTKKLKYLRYNMDVVDALQRSGTSIPNSKARTWLAHFSSSESNYAMNNKQFFLYEGYLFRYIAQFAYLIKQAGLSKDKSFASVLPFVEDTFEKWRLASVKKEGDLSTLFMARTHMGSHAATVALYLYRLSTDQKKQKLYNNVFSLFDKQLHLTLDTKSVSGHSCYVWYSTYAKPFNNYLSRIRGQKWNKAEIADVSHANMIVQYVIDAVKLKNTNWNQTDIDKFCNTLKYLLWDNATFTFHTLVNGTNSANKSLAQSGWKLSDGWAKLMKYDSDVWAIFSRFYAHNKSIVDDRYLNLQYYAVFISM